MKINRETIVSILKTIGEGEILLKLGVHKALPSILYAFLLCMLSIFLSYKVEQTMAVREKNKRKIETLKIYCAQKTCDIVSLDRISQVENMLENLGSNLEQPQRPARIIKK
jgi:Tfp pilus assembly protein PilO